MAKQPSRPQRWAEAVTKAQTAAANLRDAIEDFQSVWQEYVDWKENLPENAASSPTGEKLDTIADLDVDGWINDLETITDGIDEAEGVDLPRGFGRD